MTGGYARTSGLSVRVELPHEGREWQWSSALVVDATSFKDIPWTTIRVDARLLMRLLTRKAHWNNCEIGSLLRYDRVGPYDRGLMYHLSYLHV